MHHTYQTNSIDILCNTIFLTCQQSAVLYEIEPLLRVKECQPSINGFCSLTAEQLKTSALKNCCGFLLCSVVVVLSFCCGKIFFATIEEGNLFCYAFSKNDDGQKKPSTLILLYVGLFSFKSKTPLTVQNNTFLQRLETTNTRKSEGGEEERIKLISKNCCPTEEHKIFAYQYCLYLDQRTRKRVNIFYTEQS